jgi:RND family efflux transporter MFP subunit
MKSLLLPLSAAAALVLAGVSIARTQLVLHPTAPPQPPPRTDFPARVAALGLVEPSSEAVALSAHVAGVVERVRVRVGDVVRTGDVLVELDTRQLRAELAERCAGLEVARARVKSAAAARADADDQFTRADRLVEQSVISTDEFNRRRFVRDSAAAALEEAQAAVAAAEAAVRSVETSLERSVVRAPLDATVLQVKIRAGEYAPAGPAATPWLLLGDVTPLHVRVDVDEHEAWRVRADAAAEAQVRGNPALATPLRFVRFEPYVVPKRSLTGDSAERVDTRVLQVIYRVENAGLNLFPGQQMDVFIEASAAGSTAEREEKNGRELAVRR